MMLGMAKTANGPYEVGFGKPPQSTQFKPGQSGNPAGRPRGAKNFATAIEQELAARITITENGRRRRISKREVIAKHLVNKAAGGDLKAIPLLLNEARAREGNPANPVAEAVLDTPEDQKVLENVLRRLQSSLPESLLSPPTAEDAGAEAILPSDRAGK
jgi:Family of unknown function (DUF5681)